MTWLGESVAGLDVPGGFDYLGAVVATGSWFDSGCSAGPRVRLLPDGTYEVEGGGVPVAPLPKGVPQWSPLIASASSKHGVSPALVAGVMAIESGGDPRAVSPASAYGLMQLILPTAASQAGRSVSADELLENPELNVDLGTKYLASLWKKYGGNVLRAAAAYNAGGAYCGVGKSCPEGTTPNRWNLVADCPGGKTVDYPGGVIRYSNAAVAAGIGRGAPSKTATWKWVLGTAVVGAGAALALGWRPRLPQLRSNPEHPQYEAIRRAANILEYASEEETAEILSDVFVAEPEQVYLAVRAAQILKRERGSR